MKHFKTFCLFSIVVLFVPFFACKGNGNTGGKNNPDEPSVQVKKIFLQFDADTIEEITNADNQQITQNQEVRSGITVYVHPKTDKLAEGKAIDSWKINENITQAIKRNDTRGFFYIVNDKDAKTEGDKLIIKISAVYRDGIQVKLKFDSQSIIAYKEDLSASGGIVNLNNGDSLSEGEVLTCEVSNLGDKIVKKWKCNGSELPFDKHPNRKKIVVIKDIAKQEGNGWVLHIEIETRTAQMLKVSFVAPITCRYDDSNGTGDEILTGTSIKEGSTVEFMCNLPSGKIGENWLVNDIEKERFVKRERFKYVLKAEDAKNDVIEVKVSSHESKTVKLLLEKNMKVSRVSDGGAPSDAPHGSDVKEGDSLIFSFEQKDKIVDRWIVNGKKYDTGLEEGHAFSIEDDGSEMHIVLSDEFIAVEGGKNVVRVNYEERTVQQIKIQFDSSKIECYHEEDPDKNVNSGDKLKELVKLQFKAKNQNAVKYWKVSGRRMKAYDEAPLSSFTVLKKYSILAGGEPVMTVEIQEK